MQNVLSTIGKTPLLKLGAVVPAGFATIYAKLEFLNPGGSSKDRICLHMIESAEAAGQLKSGMTVIEPTSGNTGIGLALVCAVKKYQLILVMPENYSRERRYLMQELGAEIILSPEVAEMPGAIAQAEALAQERGSQVFMPRQFSNPANPEAHEQTTGPEILAELPPEQIHGFVAGIGTGGTISGVGRLLKRGNPNCKIIGVEPARAAVLSGGKAGVHKIQGIGAGFVPPLLQRDLIDAMVPVDDDEALVHSHLLARREGLLVGVSSGAALVAALEWARRLGPGKNLVVVFPDKGERYFSIEKYFKV